MTPHGKNDEGFLLARDGRRRAFGRRRNRTLPVLASGLFFLALASNPAFAGERTVFGKIVRLDSEARTLTVQDRKGAMWNYIVDRDADIPLGDLKESDTVSVTIGRPTPFNMISAADRLRKGDRVTKIPY